MKIKAFKILILIVSVISCKTSYAKELCVDSPLNTTNQISTELYDLLKNYSESLQKIIQEYQEKIETLRAENNQANQKMIELKKKLEDLTQEEAILLDQLDQIAARMAQ